MRRDDALTILRAQRDVLRTFGVRSLSLFGSTARDEAGADSDVDLLVDFEGPATFDRYMDVKLHLEEALGCHVDLATPKALRERLRPAIEREAILVA
jgi:predicted nucleotidyltransferase